MRLHRERLLLYLIPILLVPTLVLTFLAIRNIQNSRLLEVQQYKERQEEQKKLIFKTLETGIQSRILQTKDISSRLWAHERFHLDKALEPLQQEGLEGLFLFKKEKIFFPHLSTHLNSNITALKDPFEMEIARIPHTLNQIKFLLQRRQEHSRSPYLNMEQRMFNDFGIIKLYQAIGDPHRVIEKAKKFRKNFQQSYALPLAPHLLPNLWLMEFKALDQARQFKKAIGYTRNSMSFYFSHSQYFDPIQIAWTFEQMHTRLLSFESLSEKARSALWNLRANLQTHLRFSDLYQEIHKELSYIAQKAISNHSEVFSEFYNKKLYTYLKSPNTEEYTIAVFDSVQYHKSFLTEAQTNRKKWKNISFKFQDNKAFPSKALTGKVFWKAKEFPQWSPYKKISLYNYPESAQENHNQKRELWLYSLIGFSLALLCIGGYYILHSIRKERQLVKLKGNFLSAVTHELKTPLTSIRMFSEMMEQGRVKKPEKVTEYGKLISEESSRLQLMIESLLDYSRMEQGLESIQMDTISLSSFIHPLLLRMEQIASHRKLEWETDLEDDCIITGDARTLESLFLNLIDNAIKYTPAPGKIIVTLRKNGPLLSFSVQDSGIGISKVEQQKIFDVFYRVGDENTRSTKGSGIGLAIVKKAVDLNQGQIFVTSQVGQGTTFTVQFKESKNG